jgi:hypothetical protein
VAVDAGRAGVGLVVPLVGQDQVDVTQGERRQRRLGLGLDQLADQLGRRPRQRLHGRDRHLERHRLERGDAHPARHPAGRRGQPGLGPRRPVEQLGGVPGQDDGRIGEPDAATGRLEQRHARLPFQHRQLLGHRRGREVQRLGHRGDGAAGVQLVEQAEAAEVEHCAATLLNRRYQRAL